MKLHLLTISLAALLSQQMANATEVIVNDPSYSLSSYVSPTSTGVETDILGIYEPYSPNSLHPAGTAFVHVQGRSDAPINLVLSSYEATSWVLDGDGVNDIGLLVINGYNVSTVTGIDGSRVIDKTGVGNYLSGCARAWPNSAGGCDTPGLVTRLKAIIPTDVSSFHGAYGATDFTIRLGSAVPEASSLAYMLLGLPALAIARQRRHSRKAS
jgi:hypothetical protein